MGRICDAMHLAVKPDHCLPPFVLSHPSSHRHRSPATLMESLLHLADWGLASALQPSAQPSKLFVAFGMFNGLISIFYWEMQLASIGGAVGAKMASDCYLEC